MSEHAFSIDDAVEHGVECAVILKNIRFWLDKNKANRKNIIDGRVWTYNSNEAFSELFPYLSKSQIRRRLKSLEEKGVLIVDCHSNNNYDQTRWYSLSDQQYSMLQNRQMESTESSNGNDNIEPCIYETDSKPYSKTYNKHSETSENEDFRKDFNLDDSNKPLEEGGRKKVPPKKETELVLKEEKVWDEEVLRCYEAIILLFSEHLRPKTRVKIEKWKQCIDRLKRIDGVPLKRVYEIVKSVREDDFWRGNFDSLLKLRRTNPDGTKYIVVFNEKFPNGQNKQDAKIEAQKAAYLANSNPNDLM